jgi:hypothetical protein
MNSMSAEAEIERTELPTWEYGWHVTDGSGMPEELFIGGLG